MISDREIRMSATAMIEMFGKDAPRRARERAAEYPTDEQDGGQRFWLDVAEKSETLLEANTP